MRGTKVNAESVYKGESEAQLHYMMEGTADFRLRKTFLLTKKQIAHFAFQFVSVLII